MLQPTPVLSTCRFCERERECVCARIVCCCVVCVCLSVCYQRCNCTQKCHPYQIELVCSELVLINACMQIVVHISHKSNYCIRIQFVYACGCVHIYIYITNIIIYMLYACVSRLFNSICLERIAVAYWLCCKGTIFACSRILVLPQPSGKASRIPAWRMCKVFISSRHVSST